MHRLREVRVEDAADQVAQQAGLLLEQAVGFVVEAPLGMCTAELADGYVTRAVARELFGIAHRPDTVRLQPPERIVGVDLGAAWTELPQHARQPFFHLAVGQPAPVLVGPRLNYLEWRQAVAALAEELRLAEMLGEGESRKAAERRSLLMAWPEWEEGR